MAKKARTKPLTVQQILNMDSAEFNKLSKPQLRKAVQTLASAGNKRLKRFESSGVSSGAYQHVQRSGGKFSTKGKNLNALRAEFVRAKTFLSSKGGSITGAKKIQKDTLKALKKQGVELSPEQYNNFWKAYERLKETSPEVANKGLKYTVLGDIAELMEQDITNPEELAEIMARQLEEAYEEQEELENDTGVSRFFEIE